jgi:hypothetical protein
MRALPLVLVLVAPGCSETRVIGATAGDAGVVDQAEDAIVDASVVDQTADINCGACGNACVGDQTCVTGKCV